MLYEVITIILSCAGSTSRKANTATTAAILHTPLMSGANAIHGVVIIGAIIVMGHAESTGSMILGFLAVVLGTLNVVGGFVVTDRMLEMFKKKK